MSKRIRAFSIWPEPWRRYRASTKQRKAKRRRRRERTSGRLGAPRALPVHRLRHGIVRQSLAESTRAVTRRQPTKNPVRLGRGSRAGEGGRTLDIHVGNVTLYH